MEKTPVGKIPLEQSQVLRYVIWTIRYEVIEKIFKFIYKGRYMPIRRDMEMEQI